MGEREQLGPLLLRLRTEHGLGQKQVAELAGIDNSTLSRLESGGRGVSRETLDRLCDVFALDRRQRLEVMVAAGFLSDEMARVLADADLNRLGNILTDPAVDPDDAARLRQFVVLAIAYAEARGYRLE